MIVLSREVFVCKCSTLVLHQPQGTDPTMSVRWSRGGEADIHRLDPSHHSAAHLVELRERLRRGEWWLVGHVDGRVVTYTWLHARPRVAYPYLEGCAFLLASGVGYGYDAWTTPDLRGAGLRRAGFLEELRVLRVTMQCEWEASFFVKHQVDGATASLATVGINIIPLWRVRLNANRSLSFERLLSGDQSATPATADWTPREVPLEEPVQLCSSMSTPPL